MPKLYHRTLAEQIRWGRSNHQLWSSSTSAIETCSHKDLICHLWWGSRKKKSRVSLQEHGHFGELQGSESAGTRSELCAYRDQLIRRAERRRDSVQKIRVTPWPTSLEKQLLEEVTDKGQRGAVRLLPALGGGGQSKSFRHRITPNLCSAATMNLCYSASATAKPDEHPEWNAFWKHVRWRVKYCIQNLFI